MPKEILKMQTRISLINYIGGHWLRDCPVHEISSLIQKIEETKANRQQIFRSIIIFCSLFFSNSGRGRLRPTSAGEAPGCREPWPAKRRQRWRGIPSCRCWDRRLHRRRRRRRRKSSRISPWQRERDTHTQRQGESGRGLRRKHGASNY